LDQRDLNGSDLGSVRTITGLDGKKKRSFRFCLREDQGQRQRVCREPGRGTEVQSGVRVGK
jgi:hypothetical protein